jgi:hypothetical protein
LRGGNGLGLRRGFRATTMFPDFGMADISGLADCRSRGVIWPLNRPSRDGLPRILGAARDSGAIGALVTIEASRSFILSGAIHNF